MQGYGPFVSIPIWGIFIITLVLVLFFVEGGYQWALRNQKNYDEHEKEAPVGAMVGATLGLLAFLLAFTFSMAADSFYPRRQALTDEINAIRTTYLLTGTTRSPVMVAVAIAFSLVMMQIADLDRPGEGLINVSQRPMVELRDSLAELKF